MTTRTRVLLDCDTANEIDDQLAIAYALGCPGLDVLGVVSVHNTVAHGPTSRDRYHEEAERVVELRGRGDVHCLRGAARPMDDVDDVVASEGLEFLIEQARAAPLTLLATGPATDVAAFRLTAPELAERVTVIWAGGFPDEATWERHKLGELNARADIAAWRRLYRHPEQLSILPGWPAVATVTVAWRSFVRRLRAEAGPFGAYLADLTEAYMRRREGFVGTEVAEKVLWDIVNVAALSLPDAVRFRLGDLPTLDVAGAPDWTQPVGRVPFGLDLDAAAILADLWAALARPVEA